MRQFKSNRERLNAPRPSFGDDQGGGVAMIFAIAFVPMVFLSLVMVDYSRASSSRQTLQDALDAATLTAARSSAVTEADLNTVGRAALTAQLAANPHITQVSATFTPNETTVVASATAKIAPLVAQNFIDNYLTIGVESDVVRSINKLEIALVLDNTGSMAGTKLSNLKTAAKNFITTLAEAAERSAEPNPVKIGIVPFSMSVRVTDTVDPKTYAVPNWLDPQAKVLGAADNDIFTTADTDRFTLLKQMGQKWNGCVEARLAPYDIQDTAPSTGTPASLFIPYFSPDEPGDIKNNKSVTNNKNGSFGSFNNNYLNDDKYSKTDWKIPQGNPDKYDTAPKVGAGPNKGCDMLPLMRLSTDWGAMKSAIDDMVATGNTNVPMGLMWGWHVVSPYGPFADGTSYDAEKTSKIVVLMTDGDNVYGDTSNSNDSEHQAYGYVWQGRMGITSGTSSQMTTAMNNRLKAMCANMKAGDKNILIYTVGVQVSNSSKALLTQCASRSDMYYDVTSASNLDAAFSAIAGSIENLRISK